jgi:adenosylcobinamide-phosphate synthase
MEYYYSFSDRMFLLLIALYLSLIIGYFATFRIVLMLDVPITLWQAFLRMVGEKLNRPQRSNNDKLLRGRLVLTLLVICLLIFGFTVAILTEITQNGYLIELVLLIYLLPISSIIIPVRLVQNALKMRDMKQIITITRSLTDVDIHEADGFQIIRLLITYIASSFARYIITPIFWYLIIGMPALIVAVLFAILSDLYSNELQKNRAFATPFHFWNRLMQAIPTRISLIIMAIGLLFVPKTSLKSAIYGLQSNKSLLNTRNITTYFAAYGLKLSLGGSYVIEGYKREAAWIGDGKARLDGADLARALWWYWCNVAILLLALTAFYIQQ